MEDRKIWLEDAIYEYIKRNNFLVTSIDIVDHFKLRSDITLISLKTLEYEKKIERFWTGRDYIYRINEVI